MQPHKLSFICWPFCVRIVVIISIFSPSRGTRQEVLVGIGYPAWQSLTLSPQSPSLFPFFPIAYSFNALLRRLGVVGLRGHFTFLCYLGRIFFPLVCHRIKQETPSCTQKLDFCLLQFDIDLIPFV